MSIDPKEGYEVPIDAIEHDDTTVNVEIVSDDESLHTATSPSTVTTFSTSPSPVPMSPDIFGTSPPSSPAPIYLMSIHHLADLSFMPDHVFDDLLIQANSILEAPPMGNVFPSVSFTDATVGIMFSRGRG